MFLSQIIIVCRKMLITRTPYRISFLGGGTDYTQSLKSNGMVLSTTIDKYSYITLNNLKLFKYKYRTDITIEKKSSVSQIKHLQ